MTRVLGVCVCFLALAFLNVRSCTGQWFVLLPLGFCMVWKNPTDNQVEEVKKVVLAFVHARDAKCIFMQWSKESTCVNASC